MPRVIKATYARLLEEPEAPARPAPAEAALPIEDTAPRPDPQAEWQAAYDELIAAAQEEVTFLLEDARNEAAAIRQKAKREVSELRRRSEEEGFEKGLSRAQNEILELLESAQKEADAVLTEANMERDRVARDMEPQLFRLALDIAEKILGYELESNDGAFLSMLRQALASVKSETKATLRVNPSEYVRFFKSREVNIHTPGGTIAASVVNDPTVGYGGCLIETESGVVDAGVTAQLSQIAHNFGMDEE